MSIECIKRLNYIRIYARLQSPFAHRVNIAGTISWVSRRFLHSIEITEYSQSNLFARSSVISKFIFEVRAPLGARSQLTQIFAIAATFEMKLILLRQSASNANDHLMKTRYNANAFNKICNRIWATLGIGACRYDARNMLRLMAAK